MRIASFLAAFVITALAACSPCPHASREGVTVVPSERDGEVRTKVLDMQAKLADAESRVVTGVMDTYVREMSEPPAPGVTGTAKVAWPPEIQGRLLGTQRTLSIKMKNHIHNLANLNTVAYKRTRMNFADQAYRKVERAGPGQAGMNQKPTGLSLGTGVRVVSTEKMFDQGALRSTGRDLDLAIEGEGFFRVILPDGSTVVYTRAGNFQIDQEGNIVTNDGYILDPPVTVPQNVTRLFVDQTGLLQGFDPDNPGDLQQIGQLELARFINPSGLEAIGDNLYRETPASGDRIDGQGGLGQGFGRIRQGFLEGSNVDVFEEVMEFTETLRLYRTLRNLQK